MGVLQTPWSQRAQSSPRGMIPGKDGSKFNDIALHVKETKARTGTHPPSLSRHGVYKYFSSSEAPFPHLPNGKNYMDSIMS